MIINTEDTQDQVQFTDEAPEGEDPYFADQIAQLYNPYYKGQPDADLFFENADDIINEEELEESINESRVIKEMSAEQSVAESAVKEKVVEKPKKPAFIAPGTQPCFKNRPPIAEQQANSGSASGSRERKASVTGLNNNTKRSDGFN